MTKNERYAIYHNKTEVSILDTDNDVTDENLEVFGVDCEHLEDAIYLKKELEGVVRLLNEQEKIIKISLQRSINPSLQKQSP